MPLTRADARDEILAVVKAVTDTIAALGTASENVIWDDTQRTKPEGQDPPPTWARVIVRHVTSELVALVSDAGARRYTKQGLLTIQLFTPSDGLVSADAIVDQLEIAFRGADTPNGVWFRDPRSNEIGVEGPWFQTNVLIDFRYDQVTP